MSDLSEELLLSRIKKGKKVLQKSKRLKEIVDFRSNDDVYVERKNGLKSTLIIDRQDQEINTLKQLFLDDVNWETTLNYTGVFKRHIHTVKEGIAEMVHYCINEVFGFAQSIISSLRCLYMFYYKKTTSTFGQLFANFCHIFLFLYPFASFAYQRIKNRILRNVVYAFYVIKRILSWKKSVVITDLPKEIKWEIIKHLDFKSASKLCRLLNIDHSDCLLYHKFFLYWPVKKVEFGIINWIFKIIGWLFYQPYERNFTEIDIWTVSYAVEQMIGSNEKKFSALVRNEEFRKYIGDEIVLALSCKYGELSIVCNLIGDSINDPSIGMDYALRWAAYKGHAEIIKLLLKDTRVDPSIDNNKPLISACENGHVAAVDILLRHSTVDPSSQSNYAIEKACYNGHQEIVRRLLQDPRVDPTASRNYCLKLACKRNHIEVVRILLCDSRVRPREEDYKMIQRLIQRQSKKNALIVESRV